MVEVDRVRSLCPSQARFGVMSSDPERRLGVKHHYNDESRERESGLKTLRDMLMGCSCPLVNSIGACGVVGLCRFPLVVAVFISFPKGGKK